MKSFIHGNTYYSHANPKEELSRNFRMMRDMGITTVRVAEIWPGWSVIEPREEEFEFSVLDDYVKKAVNAGLSVCMGIGINDTPSWLYYKLPGLRFKNYDGTRSTRRVQSACFDHTEYRNYMERFIRALVQHYAGTKGITSWQLGNEIRYNVEVCDCDATRDRFREWLKTQYSSLDELNKSWFSGYGSWYEIYPYMSKEGAPTEGCAPHAIKTIQFQRWSVEDLVYWGTSIVKEYSSLPVFHNSFGSLGRNGSLWRIAEAGDLMCMDIYANTCARPGIYNGFFIEIARSIATQQNKPFWIGETAVGQYGTYKRIPTDQKLIECCVMEQIGSGIEALFYFRHKAPKWEQPHKFTGSQTILRTDVSPMEYIKTPQNVHTLMKRYEKRILQGEPVKPEVALFYPEENVFFGKFAEYDTEARENVFGARVLWSANRIPVEVVDRKGIEKGILHRFKILYLPTTWLMSRVTGEAIREFVRNGGVLISEGRPAYVDEDGLLYNIQPGAGLDEVFGCREELFYLVDRPYPVTFQDPGAQNSLLFPYQRQSYRLSGGEALCSDENAVLGVKNRYGKGEAYLLGGSPGMFFTTGGSKYDKGIESGGASHEELKTVVNFIGNLATRYGVKPPVPVSGGDEDITIRYLKNRHETLLFIVNYSQSNTQGITFKADGALELTLDGEVSAMDSVTLEPLSWKIISIQH